MYDQTPIISRVDEQEPRSSDAYTVPGRPPAVAAIPTPAPLQPVQGRNHNSLFNPFGLFILIFHRLVP